MQQSHTAAPTSAPSSLFVHAWRIPLGSAETMPTKLGPVQSFKDPEFAAVSCGSRSRLHAVVLCSIVLGVYWYYDAMAFSAI